MEGVPFRGKNQRSHGDSDFDARGHSSRLPQSVSFVIFNSPQNLQFAIEIRHSNNKEVTHHSVNEHCVAEHWLMDLGEIIAEILIDL